jgi:ankyrin repeat protein
MQQAISQELVEQFVLAAHGDFGKVRALQGQYPALRDARWAKFNESALEAASHMGNREIAEYLLAHGAPLTICTAAMLGQIDQVKRFLDGDPSLVNARGAHGFTLIFHAALSGRTEIAELLLARGGGEGMDSALHAAVMHDRRDMAEWLLTHGVRNPNAPNYAGKTPLNVALETNRPEIADVLRRHGGTE